MKQLSLYIPITFINIYHQLDTANKEQDKVDDDGDDNPKELGDFLFISYLFLIYFLFISYLFLIYSFFFVSIFFFNLYFVYIYFI